MSIEVGKTIREAREKQNITLSELSEELFIRITYLQAIENGRQEILPSPVQARGFIRLIANALHLNAEELLQQWDKAQAGEIALLSSQMKPDKTQEIVPDLSIITPEKLFCEIGEELKERREKLALTFEDAEKHTLVRSFYLHLIEEGKLSELPSMVQARGILSNYATFLNLDVDDIMLRFANALQLQSKIKQEEEGNSTDKKKKAKRKPIKKAGKLRQFITPDLFVGLIVLIGMAAIIIYSAVTISEFKNTSKPKPSMDIRQGFLQQLETAHQQQTSESLGTPITQDITTTTTPSANEEFPVVEPSNSANVTTETTEPIVMAGVIQLYIEANQRTFLKVIVDGNDAFTGRTQPGNSYPFDGSQMIEVIAGNASAISITYNQKKLGTMGKIGETLSLQFTNLYIMTPTLQYTLTPTLEPTLTETPFSQQITETPTITPYIP